jgi:hypothetical protein
VKALSERMTRQILNYVAIMNLKSKKKNSVWRISLLTELLVQLVKSSATMKLNGTGDSKQDFSS